PFSILWDKLRANGKEPISPFKQAIGLLLIAVSYFIIAHNVKDLGNSGLLAVKWLILLYLIQTFGELCLSPIGLSLVGKLSPKRFSSLLYGVFFLSNASGYALAGTLGAILPPTSEQYIAAEANNIDLKAVLDGKVDPTGEQLFILARCKAATIHEAQANKHGIELKNMVKDEKSVLTAEQFNAIKEHKLITTEYPQFAGVVIHDLYEFFMVFVVLCGIASVLLFAISPKLKQMMHGIV
ncbi:MAG: MFS transporter, partial [Bacteroidota bacterium]